MEISNAYLHYLFYTEHLSACVRIHIIYEVFSNLPHIEVVTLHIIIKERWILTI